MSVILPLVSQILHLTLMLAAAPLLAGWSGSMRARFAGRTGPPVLQPWWDLARLARKTRTDVEYGSPVLYLAPQAAMALTIAAAALVPSFTLGMVLSPMADMLAIVALLAASRIAALLGAMDAGAAPPGLAVQRASAVAALIDPGLLLALFTLGLLGGSLNLDLALVQLRDETPAAAASRAVVAAALLVLACAGGQSQDQVLDEGLSGRDLAVSRFARWLRHLVRISLIAALAMPAGIAGVDAGPLDWLAGFMAWTLKLLAITAAAAAVEACAGRVPERYLQGLAAAGLLLAALAAIMAFTGGRLA